MISIDVLEDEVRHVDIELTARDLHCVCPVNGLTDTFSVELSYVPMRGRVLELGVFRRLLDGYADVAITHEALTLDVYNTVVEQIQPARIRVETRWAPVEGVACVVMMV